jgi:hypothetical protein
MGMKRYIQRPVIIEAIQWTGKNLDELSSFLGDCLGPIERRMDYKPRIKGKNDERHFWVHLDIGDYIYRDELGFHATSERWFFQSYEELLTPRQNEGRICWKQLKKD